MSNGVELIVTPKGPAVEIQLRSEHARIVDQAILIPRDLIPQLIGDLQNPALNQG